MPCFVSYSNISVTFSTLVNLFFSAIVLTEKHLAYSSTTQGSTGPKARSNSNIWHLLKMQIYRPNPRVTKSELCRWSLGDCALRSPVGGDSDSC